MAAEYGSQGILFLLVYLFTMIFIVLNLFIALINEYIAMVKKNSRALPKDHEVITHFIDTMKAFFNRMRGNPEIKKGWTTKNIYGHKAYLLTHVWSYSLFMNICMVIGLIYGQTYGQPF